MMFIALFSGINVGKAKRIKMPELCAIFTGLGFSDVKSYVQSGNIVFRASGMSPAEAAAKIAEAFPKAAGFTSTVMVRSAKQWAALVANNPFPQAVDDPKKLHAVVLDADPAKAALDALAAASKDAGSERWEIRNGVLYLYTPDGFGTSKLAPIIGKTLKVGATARNWRTVLALQEMTKEA